MPIKIDGEEDDSSSGSEIVRRNTELEDLEHEVLAKELQEKSGKQNEIEENKE